MGLGWTLAESTVWTVGVVNGKPIIGIFAARTLHEIARELGKITVGSIVGVTTTAGAGEPPSLLGAAAGAVFPPADIIPSLGTLKKACGL